MNLTLWNNELKPFIYSQEKKAMASTFPIRDCDLRRTDVRNEPVHDYVKLENKSFLPVSLEFGEVFQQIYVRFNVLKEGLLNSYECPWVFQLLRYVEVVDSLCSHARTSECYYMTNLPYVILHAFDGVIFYVFPHTYYTIVLILDKDEESLFFVHVLENIQMPFFSRNYNFVGNIYRGSLTFFSEFSLLVEQVKFHFNQDYNFEKSVKVVYSPLFEIREIPFGSYGARLRYYGIDERKQIKQSLKEGIYQIPLVYKRVICLLEDGEVSRKNLGRIDKKIEIMCLCIFRLSPLVLGCPEFKKHLINLRWFLYNLEFAIHHYQRPNNICYGRTMDIGLSLNVSGSSLIII